MTDRPLPVIALAGLPGAGKSTLAHRLAAEFPLRLVDRDAIRQAMFPRCRFSATEKHAASRAVLHAVEANCVLGIASIVDGMTFARRAEVEILRDRVTGHGYTLLPVYLECTEDLAIARIAAARSGHPAADRDADLVRSVARRFDTPPPDAVRIDAAGKPHEVAVATIAALRAYLHRDPPAGD